MENKPTDMPNRPASLRKLIVSIHGIGDQSYCDTMQKTVRQFCRHFGFVPNLHPLGGFQSADPSAPTIWRPLNLAQGHQLEPYCFAEVYWADIPQEIVRHGHLLEETKAWAVTVAERVGQIKKDGGNEGVNPELVSRVVSEAIETIGVLEGLTSVAAHAGFAKVNLNQVLEDYLGDVQLMADYEPWRTRVAQRFQDVMDCLSKQLGKDELPKTEIYLVAHSEGTVVSFLGLLRAAAKGAESPDWLGQIRGYMTIGSPIDKHLVLWPDIFPKVMPAYTGTPIKWRNYYDFGDPVGFELDLARAFLKAKWSGLFEFEEEHDQGFSRYLVPGAAHNDYWEDDAVFDHFIADVISGTGGKRLKDRAKAHFVSYGVSYAIPVLLLVVGVYVLYTGIADYRALAPMMEESKYRFACVAAIVSLLAGVTALSRMQRIMGVTEQIKRLSGRSKTKSTGPEKIGLSMVMLAPLIPFGVFYGLAIWARTIPPSQEYPDWLSVHYQTQFAHLFPSEYQVWIQPLPLAIFAVLLSFGIAKLTRIWPDWGMKPLMAAGGLTILGIVWPLLSDHHDSLTEIWPVLLAGGIFLYLWWLAALIFDLVFIWHRYIRCSTASKVLKH
jgi:hypothetical protein